jgi:hypothetical protein
MFVLVSNDVCYLLSVLSCLKVVRIRSDKNIMSILKLDSIVTVYILAIGFTELDEEVQHLLRYLEGTTTLGLQYSKPLDCLNLLWVFVDSDWAGCPAGSDTRCSSAGLVVPPLH